MATLAEAIKERLEEINEAALLADDHDEALVGIALRFGMEPVACYSYEGVIKILMERDGMDYDEAVEFFDFNIIGAWVGEGTPVYITVPEVE